MKTKTQKMLYNTIVEIPYLFTYNKRKKQLANILSQARAIIDKSEIKTGRNHPIFSFVTSISKMIFFNNLVNFYSTHTRENSYYSYIQELGLFENTTTDRYDIINNLQINLASNAILSFPWDKDKIVNNLSTKGSDVNNPFIYQSNNHFSQLFMPLGLTFVYNGLHSISSGIVKGEGSIIVSTIEDLSQNCNDFYFDGLYIRNCDNNKIVHLVKHFESGVLFELSRIILENNIDFLADIDIERKVAEKIEIDKEWRIYSRNNTKILHFCVYDNEGECEFEVNENTIIFTTTADSFGMSTTNAAEFIADYVAKEYNIPLNKVICYEHYLSNALYNEKEIINRIEFDIEDNTLVNPDFIPDNLPS